MSSGSRRAAARLLLAAGLALASGSAWSCASGGGDVVVPAEPIAGDTTSLWRLPEDALRTQRIVKLHYDGPKGDGTLNLVLRLEREDRFSLQGNDQLGRGWFRLAVEDASALFLDLRGKTFCRFEESIEISAVPLGPLPFDQLPALLLGRLPVVPVESTRQGEGGWRLRDQLGREWTAQAPEGQVESWTLWHAGEPEVWWHRDQTLSYLSARTERLQLRWRTAPGEALTRPPAALEVPEGFTAGTECGGPDGAPVL